MPDISFGEGIGASDVDIRIGDVTLRMDVAQFGELFEAMRQWWTLDAKKGQVRDGE